MSDVDAWIESTSLPTKFADCPKIGAVTRKVFNRVHENRDYYWNGGWGKAWEEVLIIANDILDEE